MVPLEAANWEVMDAILEFARMTRSSPYQSRTAEDGFLRALRAEPRAGNVSLSVDMVMASLIDRRVLEDKCKFDVHETVSCTGMASRLPEDAFHALGRSVDASLELDSIEGVGKPSWPTHSPQTQVRVLTNLVDAQEVS